tara:strand:+ start:898 stop:1290 length:393 start_codon:yes stop_codon:yes gene_type:complete
MTDSVVIDLDFLPPIALSPNGRAHWSKKYRAGKALGEAVYLRLPGGPLSAQEARTEAIDPAVVSYHVRWCGKAPDEDNFSTSMKPALDEIVAAGILEDDGPGHVKRIEVTYERVKHRAETGVRITVSPVT